LFYLILPAVGKCLQWAACSKQKKIAKGKRFKKGEICKSFGVERNQLKNNAFFHKSQSFYELRENKE
jgi:hypothetical protein